MYEVHKTKSITYIMWGVTSNVKVKVKVKVKSLCTTRRRVEMEAEIHLFLTILLKEFSDLLCSRRKTPRRL